MSTRLRTLIAVAGFLTLGSVVAGEFGTPEQCATVGGVFRWGKDDSSWQGVCVLETTPQDCQARRGWVQSRSERAVTCFLPTDSADRKVQCEAAGGYWGRFAPAARYDYCHFDKFVANCKARGGSWEARGSNNIPHCVFYSKDAGKACTSRRDCEFACEYHGPEPRPGTSIVGQCAPDDSNVGCRKYVADGKYERGPCVD